MPAVVTPGRIGAMTVRRRACGMVGSLLCHAVFAVLLVSAVVKLIDMESFGRSVATWSLVPAWMHPLVTVAVPLAEFGVSLSWFAGFGRIVCLVLAAAGLSLATIVYSLHLALARAPDCGCFGFLLRHQRWVTSGWENVARNAVLIAAVIVGGALRGVRQGAHRRTGTAAPARGGRSRSSS